MSETLSSRFVAAFEGSDLAYGQSTVGRVGKGGKVEAKSFVIRGPLTEALVADHFKGGQGVGAIPISSGNQCKFGVIDIDEYDLDHRKLLRLLESLNLPLITCRSKSGGAHLYLFLDTWYEAALVREYLAEIASTLGFAGREIFPKQDKLLVDRGDVGNFINLPYFKADQTVRYAFNADGSAMSLEEFLDKVERTRVPLAAVNHLGTAVSQEDLKDYPPCLERLASQGGITGTRNICMFNFAVAAKKQMPDAWRERLEQLNGAHCSPPLGSSEMLTLQKQHEKKTYGFQCTQHPLVDFCDKALCRTRKFGIGGDAPPDLPNLSGLTIVLSDPRIYFLDVSGRRLELTLDQLISPQGFQRECVRQLEIAPTLPSPKQWSATINALLSNATHIEVPPELTSAGHFEDLLKEFCTSRVRAMSPEEVVMGKPWTDSGRTMFRIDGLMEFLKQKDFTAYTKPQVQEQLKRLNDGGESTSHLPLKKSDGKRTTLRVWGVPAFEVVEADMGYKDVETGLPF